MGGMVLETSMTEILSRYEEQNKLEKSEVDYFVFCFIFWRLCLLAFFLLLQVHFILSELCMGGMVLETNMNEILTRTEEQSKLEKHEV